MRGARLLRHLSITIKLAARETLVVDLVWRVLRRLRCPGRPGRNGLGAAVECDRKNPRSDRSTGSNRAGTSANR